MNDIFKNILQNPISFSREGQYIVVEELARDAKPSDILSRLPLIDLMRLYDSLASARDPHISDVSPEAYHAVVTTVEGYIDLKQKDALKSAILIATGRTQLREKKEEDKKSGFDGFQTNDERVRQLYLAHVISTFLPDALKETPGMFIATRLSEIEQGTALAILSAPRADNNSAIQQALRVLSNSIKLTPVVWNSFQSTCKELDKNPSRLLDGASTLVDKIVEREILRLSPDKISNLEDRQAYRYIQALGWSGNVTPTFRSAQLYLYENLQPSLAIRALREQQIDKFVELSFAMNEDEFAQWQHVKKSWTEKSASEKCHALTAFASSFSTTIDLPLRPKISVVSWNDAPDKPKSLSNGYYIGWKTIKSGDKPKKLFTNEIFLVDDDDALGNPLSARRTLRSALSTSIHEALHSHDTQIIARHSDKLFDDYVANFDATSKPSKIALGEQIGYAAGALLWTSIGRTSYVSPTTNLQLYRHQPYEKNAWSFQNQFAAALNGALVAREVDAGARNLHDELRILFKRAGHVLSARVELTGDAQDIVPLKNYERSQHPFGALTLRDGETAESGSRAEESSANYVAIDFSAFDGRSGVLTHLQDSLNALGASSPSTSKDCNALFLQSADFLIQMPDEIWAIKKKLVPEHEELANKLDALAIKAQSLGEDLSDYCFVVDRKKKIETRDADQEAQRRGRHQAACRLAAIL